MRPLTVTDYRESLRVFHALEVQGRRPPTVREYADHMGMSSTSVATYRLRGLVELGWLELAGGRLASGYSSSRSLVVSDKGKQVLGIIPVPAPSSGDVDHGGCL